MPKPIIGAHVSAAGGYVNALVRARAIGAEAIQIFGASPRQWATLPLNKEAVAEFVVANRKEKMPVFLHAPYLANIASPERGLQERSEKLLSAHLAIAEALGAEGLIFHVGSGKELPRAEALAATVRRMKNVLAAVPGNARLIIENSAGGGEKIGRDFAEIHELVAGVDSERVGVCFDTAHAFEAGLVAAYTDETLADLARTVEKTFGWKRLCAIHANDSKTVFNSHHDRHENIGKGYIGLDGFRALLRHPKFSRVPFLLEVPGFANEGPDKKNVDILRGLVA